jgi:predicted outer membrane repeat protein
MMVKRASSFLAERCLFYLNRSTNGGGGAFWEGYSQPRVVGCTFSHNSAPTGGALYGKESYPLIENSILAFSGDGAAFACGPGVYPGLTCTDIYGNADGDWTGCIAGQEGMNGNFSSDPRFCDANGGDFTLEHGSPCLDAPGCGLVGAFGEGCGGSTAVEMVSWGGIKKMFR